MRFSEIGKPILPTPIKPMVSIAASHALITLTRLLSPCYGNVARPEIPLSECRYRHPSHSPLPLVAIATIRPGSFSPPRLPANRGVGGAYKDKNAHPGCGDSLGWVTCLALRVSFVAWMASGNCTRRSC